jgi:hypothetical protein
MRIVFLRGDAGSVEQMMQCAVLIIAGSSPPEGMRSTKGMERWEGLRPGSHAIVACWDVGMSKMAGGWPGLWCDMWFRAKPRHRPPEVGMSPEPCAVCRVPGARQASCDPLTAAKTQIRAAHRSRVPAAGYCGASSAIILASTRRGGETGICVACLPEGGERINRLRMDPMGDTQHGFPEGLAVLGDSGAHP